MNKSITFTIMGDPRGKERPRWCANGKRSYTPKKTVEYEKQVAAEFMRELMESRRFMELKPLESAIELEIDAYFHIPKSYSGKRAEDCANGKELPTKKPDADNIAKIIMDGLNGVAFKDDCQVVSVTCSKWYAKKQGYVQVSMFWEEGVDEAVERYRRARGLVGRSDKEYSDVQFGQLKKDITKSVRNTSNLKEASEALGRNKDWLEVLRRKNKEVAEAVTEGEQLKREDRIAEIQRKKNENAKERRIDMLTWADGFCRK